MEQKAKLLRGNHISLHELVSWRQAAKCNMLASWQPLQYLKADFIMNTYTAAVPYV